MSWRSLHPVTEHEALGSGDDLLALQAHALRAVLSLVPGGAAAFVTLGRRFDLERVVFVFDEPRALLLGEVWHRHLTETWGRDPLSKYRTGAAEAVVALADATLDETQAAALRAARIGDRVVAYLRVSGAMAAAVILIRSAHQQPFDRRDLATLRRIRPLLERVYGAAVGERGGPTVADLRARGLTPREAEIARLAAEGASNAEIGRALHVTEATVRTHLRRVYAKLGVRSRLQLAISLGDAEDTISDAHPLTVPASAVAVGPPPVPDSTGTAPTPADRLLAHILEMLSLLVAADAAIALRLGFGGAIARGMVFGAEADAGRRAERLLERLRDLGSQERTAPEPVRYLKLAQRLELGPPGVVDLWCDAGRAAELVLLRTAASGPFDAAELERLRSLRPFLEAALQSLTSPGRGAQRSPEQPALTAREADVLRLVARGDSNAAVGFALGLTEATVKGYLTRIYAKLGVRSRTQLAAVMSSVCGVGPDHRHEP